LSSSPSSDSTGLTGEPEPLPSLYFYRRSSLSLLSLRALGGGLRGARGPFGPPVAFNAAVKLVLFPRWVADFICGWFVDPDCKPLDFDRDSLTGSPEVLA